MRIATSLVVLGLLTASAAADVISVPQDQPTIQAAVDAAVSGDTVQISAGVYSESVQLTKRTGLTLKAKGVVELDVQGGTPAVVIDTCDQIELAGLRIVGGTGHGIEVTDSTGVTLNACRFQDQLGDGLHATGSSGVSCVKCRAELVTGAGFAFSPGGADEPCDQVLVQKCRTEHCITGIVVRGDAPQLISNRIDSSSSSGISLIGVTAGTVTHNRVKNQFGGIAIRVATTSALTEITHNRVDGSGAGIDVENSQQTNLRHNAVKFDAFGCVFTNCSDCTGEKNTIVCGDAWVSQGCDHITLTGNKLKGNDTGPGISLTFTDTSTVQDCKLRHYAGALNITGDDNTVTDCLAIKPALGLTMDPGNDNTQVSGLRVTGATSSGMFVDGTGASVSGCKIVKSAGDGMRIFGTGASITGNKVTKSGASGFRLEVGSSGNTLSANVAKGSHEFDLLDESGGANDVQDDNTFGTTSP